MSERLSPTLCLFNVGRFLRPHLQRWRLRTNLLAACSVLAVTQSMAQAYDCKYGPGSCDYPLTKVAGGVLNYDIDVTSFTSRGFPVPETVALNGSQRWRLDSGRDIRFNYLGPYSPPYSHLPPNPMYTPYQGGNPINPNVPWDYTMGYAFTPNKWIVVTSLGGYFNGTKTVYLYDRQGGGVLASTPVTASNNWGYAPIPRTLLAPGHDYSVGVWLGGTGGAWRTDTMPKYTPDVEIKGSCFRWGTTAEPCAYSGVVSGTMYGMADLMYEAQVNVCSVEPDGHSTIQMVDGCDGLDCRVPAYSCPHANPYTHEIYEADIVVFNRTSNDLPFSHSDYSTAHNPQAIDMYTVLEHEMGHAIGLCHCGPAGQTYSGSDALMSATFDYPHRQLSATDKYQVSLMYPANRRFEFKNVISTTGTGDWHPLWWNLPAQAAGNTYYGPGLAIGPGWNDFVMAFVDIDTEQLFTVKGDGQYWGNRVWINSGGVPVQGPYVNLSYGNGLYILSWRERPLEGSETSNERRVWINTSSDGVTWSAPTLFKQRVSNPPTFSWDQFRGRWIAMYRRDGHPKQSAPFWSDSYDTVTAAGDPLVLANWTAEINVTDFTASDPVNWVCFSSSFCFAGISSNQYSGNFWGMGDIVGTWDNNNFYPYPYSSWNYLSAPQGLPQNAMLRPVTTARYGGTTPLALTVYRVDSGSSTGNDFYTRTANPGRTWQAPVWAGASEVAPVAAYSSYWNEWWIIYAQ